MIPLLRLPAHNVYYLPRTAPAVFFLADREAGGVLVNTPAFSPPLVAEFNRLAPLRFAFFPSCRGARDIVAWRSAGVRLIAYGDELAGCGATADVALDRGWRLSRGIDFLPMSGRTAHTCALRCKGKPAIIFFGPALSRGASGWPALAPNADDYSYENRVLGAVALRHLKFDYAFTDDFHPVKSRFGPGAGRAIHLELERMLESS